MSSTNQPKWTTVTALGQSGLVTDSIATTLSSLEKANKTVLKTLGSVETAANIVLPFVSTSSDAIATLVKASSTAFRRILGEVAAYGGHMILIHPNNRMQPRKVNIGGPHPIEFQIPALSPYEAFQELETSFSNTADPFRPRWTPTSPVAGFGLLLTAPNPEGLATLLDAVSQLINLKEFVDIKDSIWDKAEVLKKDIKVQGLTDAWKETAENPETITVSPAVIKRQLTVDKRTKAIYSAAKAEVIRLTVRAPTLHWTGLSLYNFPYIKEFIDYLDEVADSLSRLADSTNTAIQETIQIIFKKIRNLSEILTKAYEVFVRITQTIQTTGIYLITIPPELGGVPYIMTALRSTLATSSDPGVAALRSSIQSIQFSALFFAGVSGPTKKELEAWYSLFNSAWTASSRTIEEAQQVAADKWVALSGISAPQPDGSTISISSGSVIPRDSQPLVISSTPPLDPEDPQTFSIEATTDTDTISSFTSTEQNAAVAGVSSFTIPIPSSDLTIQFTYPTGSDAGDTVAAAIQTSTLLAAPLLGEYYETPIPIRIKSTVIGTISVSEVSATGTKTVVEKQFVYRPTDPIYIGSTVSAGYKICEIRIYDQVSEVTESYLCIIDTRYPIVDITDTQFNSSSTNILINIKAFPIYCKFTSARYSVVASGTTDKQYIKIPSYRLINNETVFDYVVYDRISKIWRPGYRKISLVERDVGFMDIC